MLRLVVLAMALAAPSEVFARAVFANSCVVTIGRFCPVETVGVTLFMVALVLAAGVPLRLFLRRSIMRDLVASPNAEVRFKRWLYERAGFVTLFTVVCIAGALFAAFQ